MGRLRSTHIKENYMQTIVVQKPREKLEKFGETKNNIKIDS
jgi:hypothetical protein